MYDIISIVSELNKHFIEGLEISENGQSIYVKSKSIVNVMKLLKEEFDIVRLSDMTAVDYEDRYEVVYHLSDNEAEMLTLKVKLDKNNMIIPTITHVFKYANEQEREIYDLMGIVFKGHENLKRILCPDDFVGHPLQKSFKLSPAKRF
ncbi:NADH-quinone oxidoreductase subunit C 1 [Oxobacter pfennigii]|uniref:NADH-quinone oxidoreductase n=1 Tax=Oxobacter pfennigii TaxID=36849 RepID=A0A0P8WDP2_9CLOT|nr:NADH-quinone oxidoreductase subunit C [Oxobacter pfennigii]KPU46101.1 NADH-quinone oxidoreductase subunit C 1 [Oxobacter pfennigii]